MLLREIILERIYIAQDVSDLPTGDRFVLFRPDAVVYHPFCDDFGPMSLSSVIIFIEQLDAKLQEHPDSHIIYDVDSHPRWFANGVFLLGAYMIISMGKSATEVTETFDWLDESLVEDFRDATFSHADFRLTLEDCWRGLERGVALGWLRPSEDEHREQWGEINILEYRHYDSPANGDFHVVVPGSFVAFKGPADMGGRAFTDGRGGDRTFSPATYADIFADDFHVAAVVRLNEEEYDPEPFEARGIKHHALPFPDCGRPPPDVVAAFLAASDPVLAGGGAVAVHCRAGLGRTGTLIALQMMRRHGFGAREAMGWLRIMRPGSVIGPQQHFLCAAEGRPDMAGGLLLLSLESDALWTGAMEEVGRRVLAAEVAAGAARRGAARAGHKAGGAARGTLPSVSEQEEPCVPESL
jgi:cell division cycle 14